MIRVFQIGLLLVLAAGAVGCSDQTQDSPAPADEVVPAHTQTPTAARTPVPALAVPTASPTVAPIATQQPSSSPTPTPAATATPIPVPTLAPTLTPAPSPLTATQIFSAVSPAIAFLETPIARGSGVLISGGYLVTNAHVVWPFNEARVVFPDGSQFPAVPVANWDHLGDLAVLGPIDVSIDPLQLVNGEDLAIGSDTYLIGYPGEAETFPQPTISRGIISRLREWNAAGMTFFQTDAAIAGGQSGGVLVSEEGKVIGISGLRFTEAGFGLVASAADILPRAERLIAGEDVSGLGQRRVPSMGGIRAVESTLESYWDSSCYVVNEPDGTDIHVDMTTEQDARLFLVGPTGTLLLSADESGSATTQFDAPHFLCVGLYSGTTGDFSLSSDRNLVPFQDADDGLRVSIGQDVIAAIDHPLDDDYFVITLDENEAVEIKVDSPYIDPFLLVGFPEASAEQQLYDDDSGGGFFGLNAKLTYLAPHAGEYFVVVSDSVGVQVGGYVLSISRAAQGATAVSPPTPTPRTIVDTPFGPMALYEDRQQTISIQHPSGWTAQPAVADAGIEAIFAGNNGEQFVVTVEDFVDLGLGELTLTQYVDLVVATVEGTAEGYELIAREAAVTAQGLAIEVVDFMLLDGGFKASRLVYVHEATKGFSVTYGAPVERYGELEPLKDYSFSTFHLVE